MIRTTFEGELNIKEGVDNILMSEFLDIWEKGAPVNAGDNFVKPLWMMKSHGLRKILYTRREAVSHWITALNKKQAIILSRYIFPPSQYKTICKIRYSSLVPLVLEVWQNKNPLYIKKGI